MSRQKTGRTIKSSHQLWQHRDVDCFYYRLCNLWYQQHHRGYRRYLSLLVVSLAVFRDAPPVGSLVVGYGGSVIFCCVR